MLTTTITTPILVLQSDLASRFELFSSRIHEVPPGAFDEMSCAVYELSQNVLRLTGIAEAKRQSPAERMMQAAAALRGASLEGERDDLEALDACMVEMFKGLEQLKS